MSEGLLVVADEGRVLVYNRAAEELLDLAPDTLAVGASLSDLAGLPELSALLARAAESTDGQDSSTRRCACEAADTCAPTSPRCPVRREASATSCCS